MANGGNAARVGDKTDHGGTLMIGHKNVLINKLPAITLGDYHDCPKDPAISTFSSRSKGAVQTGVPTVLIGDLPAARVGDKIGCGAVIIERECSESREGECKPVYIGAGTDGEPYPIRKQNCYGYAVEILKFGTPGYSNKDKDPNAPIWCNDVPQLNLKELRKQLTSDLGEPIKDGEIIASAAKALEEPKQDGRHKVQVWAHKDIKPDNPRYKEDWATDEEKCNYDWDFHFYKQDSDGLWSHKAGTYPVMRFDLDGKEITSPHISNKVDSYSEYVGTWFVDDKPNPNQD